MGHDHLLSVVIHLILLLVGKVFIELAPPPLLFFLLPVGIIIETVVVVPFLLLPFLVQLLLKCLISHEVPHLLCLVHLLLKVVQPRILLPI
mmetsp:Transcript_36825/g.35539  ORF Transcript_36825/g.35539 Transcript_36825/m.35539 type:complete len:91 (-) Transcript_36825:505-777(-)